MAKRFVGIVVLSLTAALLLTPIPFSNIPPAVLVILIALAYIEEDGLLLCLAFLFAVILISIASVGGLGHNFRRSAHQRHLAIRGDDESCLGPGRQAEGGEKWRPGRRGASRPVAIRFTGLCGCEGS